MLRSRGNTVLVAEDSPLLRRLLTTILTRAGYEPLVAACGEDALELWSRNEEDVALLVTDLTMPGMGGLELIARLREARPSLPIVCTTGHADASGFLPKDVEFLEKPFTPSVLLAVIERALRKVETAG